jgi:hypothetical protein
MTKFKWLANLGTGYSDGGLWQLFRPKVNCRSPFDFAQGRLSASSGFPVGLRGVDGPHAAFLSESRIRGR